MVCERDTSTLSAIEVDLAAWRRVFAYQIHDYTSPASFSEGNPRWSDTRQNLTAELGIGQLGKHVDPSQI